MKRKILNELNKIKKSMCFSLNIKINQEDVNHFYFINREQRKFFNG